MLGKYWQVYRQFVNHSFAEAMSFRAHFVLLIVMDLFFYLSLLGSIDFIFQHIDQIGPWQKPQFMFFASFMVAIDHLHMTFISESFWNLSRDIRTGRLDFVLIKPIGSLFQIFFRYIRPGTMLNGFVPWSLLIYYGLELNLSVWDWILLPILIVCGLTLLTSVEILLSMVMFWTVESFGINFLRMQLQQLARWPDFIYRFYARKLFSFGIPVLLVGSAPVQFLFDRNNWERLVLMLVLIVVNWMLIGKAWQWGLRSYESASS
jgi:ABC-2 type transport system permease protein